MRERPPRIRPRKVLGLGLLAAALAVGATWFASASADEIEDLRGHIPTGDELRAELGAIAGERRTLLAGLNSAEADLTATLAAREALDTEQQRLAVEIEIVTENLRDVAVRSFLTGGPVGNLGFLLEVTEASDLAWRQHLVRNHAGAAEVAIGELRELEARASDDVKESIETAARLRTEIDRLEESLAALVQREAEVEELRPLAEAWDRAVIAIEEGSFGIAPEEKWEALRFCESTHDYRAISPTGRYRGAYQFDMETWQTVGGTGDPADAPAEEQDARARELYARRGDLPWPKCGRHLR